MKLQEFYVSWVDLVVVILLFVGLKRGQKRGMSEELLYVMQWVTILAVAGIGYRPVGEMLAGQTVFSKLFSYVTAYLGLALLVKAGFAAIRSSVGDKLLQSDAFGPTEYYLGMLAGVFRYGCVMVLVFALLNAPQYTPAEKARIEGDQLRNFGSKFFPSVPDLQDEVFGRSYAGRAAQQYLGGLMIGPTMNEGKTLRSGTAVRARESAINELLEKK